MSRVIDGKEESGQFLDDFWIEYNELVLKNTELSGAERKEKKTMRVLQKLEIKNIHTSRENQQSILSKYNMIKSKSVRKGRLEHNTHIFKNVSMEYYIVY